MSASASAPPARAARRCIYRHRTIDPVELPRVLRKHIYTGVMGTAYYRLVTGVFFVFYWKRLGGTPEMWGVLAALMQLMLSGQLVSAYLTSRTGQRKKLWYRSELVSRLLRLASIAAGAAILPFSALWACRVFAALVVAATFFQSVAAPAWQSWLTSIVPAARHGSFMGRRGAWVAAGVVGLAVPCGLILDAAPAAWKQPVVLGIFAMGIVVGLVDLVIHRTIPEPAVAVNGDARPMVEFLRPLGDARFRPFLLFHGVWTFAVMFGAVMTWPFWTERLHIDNSMLITTLVTVAAPMGLAIVAHTWIGRLIDRLGTRRVLRWGSGLWAAIPLLWLAATPANAWILMGVWAAISCLGCDASMLAANKIQTRSAPPEHTACYVAVSTAAGALAATAGAFAGSLAFAWMAEVRVSLGPVLWGRYELLFVASGLMRYASVLLIGRIQEPAAAAGVVATLAEGKASRRRRTVA